MKKNIILLIAIFLMSINYSYSQKPKEIKNSKVKVIFLTHADFKRNKLICSSLRQNKNIKIKLNQFFISLEISSFELKKNNIFYKDSIFAIQLDNGVNYRLISRKPCLIADTSFLINYKYNTVKTEYKQSGPTRRAKEIPVVYYHFSSEQHKEVYPLTITNLCNCLHLESDIKISINQKFENDEMLYSINQKTGRFFLNEFLT